MTKDRPFKNYKTPTDRPFKSYDPVRTSMLYDNNYQQEPQIQQQAQQQSSLQQSLRFSSMSSLLQQQQQQQQQNSLMFSQQQQTQQPTANNQQVYGDPEDFIHLNPQSNPNSLMNIDPTLNTYYDDLGLDDPDNPLIRPDLLVASEQLLQREQDLNIPNTTAPPNFIMPPNRHSGMLPRIPSSGSTASMQDTLSMLFDQPQQSIPTFTSSPSLIATTSPSNLSHQFLMSKTADAITNSPLCPITSSPFLTNMNTSLRGEILAGNNPSSSNGSSSSSNNGLLPSSSSYPVKQEADDGRSTLVESPSPSVQSPTQSEPADSFSESTPKPGVKRSLSESASSIDQGDMSEQGTSSGAKPKCESSKDPSYLEKRRKNNESAKRSREARRSKEELVALRVITLEEENMKLRAEIGMLDKELDELRQRLFQQ